MPGFTAPESDLEQPKGFTAPESDVAAPAPISSSQPAEVEPINPAMLRAAAIAGGGQFVGGYPISGPAAVRAAITGGRMIGEGAGTALAQGAGVAAGPMGPSVAGAAAARFLNTIGQAVEYAVYNKPFDYAENEKATLMGAVPLVGPEQIAAQRMASASPSAIRNALEFGGKLGTAGGLTEATVETAKTGQLPEPGKIAEATLAPFVAGTAGGYLAEKGSNLIDRAGEISDNIRRFMRTGVEPTPGMVEPRRFAGLEAQVMRERPTGDVSKQVNKVYGDLAENITQSIPQTLENKTVYDRLYERSTGIAKARAELDKLGPKVQAAQREADSSLLALNKSRDQFFSDVSKANEDALGEVGQAALENARKAAIQRVQGATDPMSQAKARDFIVQNVIKPMDGAYDAHWQRLYSMFPDKEKAFDTKPILEQAKSIYDNYNLKVPSELNSILREGTEEGGNVASLAALRNLRELLLKKGKISDADPTAMQSDLRRLGGFITEQMDTQADKVFGSEGAAQFRNIQADYKNYSDLWHKPGVEMLYENNPTSDVVTKIVNGIKESGSDADEYKNLRNLIANLAAPQRAAKDYMAEQYVVSGKPSTIDPELAGRLASHVNDVIRSNIFWQASKNGRVDPTALIGTLDKIGRDPEALRMLQFGTQEDVASLSKLFKDNPQASRMTPQALSDAFLSVNLKGGQKASAAELLASPVKASQIENQLVKAVYDEGLKNVTSAQKRLNDAVNAAKDIGISASQVEARLQQLRADPLYNFFDRHGPIPAQGFNEMVKVLFSPSANAMTNKDVQSIFGYLRASNSIDDKQLLQNLQRAYLQNHLVDYVKSGTASQEGGRISVTKLNDLLAPAGRSSAQNELDRMTIVLDPEQINAVKKTLDAASMLRTYEREAAGVGEKVNVPPSKYNIFKRGYEAAADMLLRRDYNKAVDAMLNPSQYANALAAQGEWMKAAGQATKGIAPTIQRFLPQQQAPSFLNQFAQPQPSR